ncbi:MAG: O-antigen polymerase, partial [Solirubrobacterales bacterium]|nr:O-antigen polymerase [Solirubrobacterales bacterium]
MSHATEVREEEAAGTVALERRFVPAFDAPAIGAWVLPFALILLLAFSGGGYDPIVRGQVGILLWWFVLVGAATGSVAVLGGRWAWAGVTLLAAFAVWTGLAITWTESTERTVAELARVATLLGVLVLALASQRHVAARHAVNGAACAIAVVAGAAVLSRLQPGLFGVQQVEEIFPTSKQRLSFPVGYWNLLAGLAVIGLPLLLAVAGAARTTVGRALATAALPVVVLCVFLTVSRGAIGAAGVAVVVFFLLAPDRLPKLAYAAIGGVGGLVLCLAADNRDALQQNLGNALAQEQGDALLGLTILVCLGAALLAAGVGLADRHATRPRWTQPGRKFTSVVALAVVVLGLVAFVGGGGPGWAGERADEFKAQTDTKGVQFDDAVSRLQTVSGNGRYQYWQAAERAKDTDALKGIGPGTFEFWWAREGTISGGFVRDSHSLWADALAETGLVGFTLLVAFFLFVLLTGAIRALRA